TTQTTPWAPQSGALQNAFSQAGTALGKSQNMALPTDFVAQFSPDQLAAYKSMVGYGSNNQIPGQEAAAGTGMFNTGGGAGSDALANLNGFNPYGVNTPQNVMEAALGYASGANQYIPDAVANAMLPAMQQVRDVTLPGMEADAAGSGNINSSRTGI